MFTVGRSAEALRLIVGKEGKAGTDFQGPASQLGKGIIGGNSTKQLDRERLQNLLFLQSRNKTTLCKGFNLPVAFMPTGSERENTGRRGGVYLRIACQLCGRYAGPGARAVGYQVSHIMVYVCPSMPVGCETKMVCAGYY